MYTCACTCLKYSITFYCMIKIIINLYYALTQGKCMFEYLPLKVGEFTGKLTLSNSDLGVYQYELHLRSTCPPPERPIHFTTSLGVSQQQAVRFVSYARGRTEYICKVSRSVYIPCTYRIAGKFCGVKNSFNSRNGSFRE